MRIWKFNLSIQRGSVNMPENAKVLHVAFQGETLMLWAKCEDNDVEERRFRAIATGEPFEEEDVEYVETIHRNGEVWHVHEQIPPLGGWSYV